MPRKKTTPAPARPPAADDNSEFDQETEDDIEQLLGSGGDRTIAGVYRIGKPGERDGFLDTVTGASLLNPTPEQVLRDTYGAGNYRLRIKAPNTRGVLVYAGTKTYTIADRTGAAASNGNGRPHGSDDLLREELNRQQSLILALIGSNKPQQLDLQGLAALLVAIGGGGNKQSDLGAVVAAFTSLKAAADPQTGLAQVKDVLEIAKSISGGGAPAGGEEPDAGWPGLIRGALSALTGGGAAPARRMIPAAAVQPPAADDDEEPGEDEMFQRWLSGQLQFLKSKAATNKPVEFWIQYTVDNADEMGNQAIFGALKGGATFENLLAFDPEIATNPNLRLWFQKFYDGLKRSLSPATPLPWIVGNSTNVTDHAIPGADRQPAAGDSPGGGSVGHTGSD